VVHNPDLVIRVIRGKKAAFICVDSRLSSVALAKEDPFAVKNLA
jgi:hypothetical protein